IFSTPQYPKLAKRQSELEELINLFDNRAKYQKQITEAREIAQGPDPEMAKLAQEELSQLETSATSVEAQLAEALTPKDPNDEKDVIMEIRAAAGGDEASLFAGDLFRMYSRWAERRGFKVELVSE